MADKTLKQMLESPENRFLIREGLATNFLKNLSKSELSDKIVLQGGNALHLVYGSPRYSRDLDFVVEDFSGFDKEKLQNIDLNIDGLVLKPQLTKDILGFMRVAYYLPINDTQKLSLKIEIYNMFSHTARKRQTAIGDINVEDPSEIFEDKILATIQRNITKRIKETDLFDMYYIITNYGLPRIDKDKLNRKALRYGMTVVDEDCFRAVKEACNIPPDEFKNTIINYFPTDYKFDKPKDILSIAKEGIARAEEQILGQLQLI